MQMAADGALSDILFVVSEKADTRFKKASYLFIDSVLTKTAAKRSLEEMFERNLEG